MSRKKRKNEGICPKCQELIVLTKHHVMPRRHFGYGKDNSLILLICRSCHDELENDWIPLERMPDEFYTQVIVDFLEVS